MGKSLENRLVYKVDKDGLWKECLFSDLKKDDLFELYEADYEFVGAYQAMTDAYLNGADIWCIQTVDYYDH